MTGRRASFRDWFLLTRPWSVTATLIPFLFALAVVAPTFRGSPDAALRLVRWAAGLVSGVSLLAACNLFNTYGDEKSGVDRMAGAFLTTPQIQEGKITLRQTFAFGAVCVAVAAALGFPLLWWRDPAHRLGPSGWFFSWPLLAGAMLGFFGALNYSTGTKYKYRGLGVPYVAFFEGLLYVVVVAMIAVPELAAALARWDRAVVAAVFPPMVAFAAPIMALVGVVLHGNDMRDIATDRAAGISTLASRLGPRGSLALFAALHALPYACVAALAAAVLARFGAPRAAALLLPFAAAPLTLRLLARAVRDYRANPAAPAWLGCEQGSGKVHFVFGLLWSAGVYLADFSRLVGWTVGAAT